MLKVGDIVIVKEVVYGDPVKYKVAAVQLKPGPEGPLYLIDSPDGIRLARYGSQLTKVD